MLEDIRRCGSRLEFSATTEKTTSPGERNFSPSLRDTSLQCGGKIEETRTRFCDAMPASRSASSKDVKRSLCFSTPFVRKRRLGTMSLPNSEILLKACRKNKTNRNFAWCGKEIHNWINFLLSGSGMRQLLYGFPVYGDLHKRSSGPAESLVFSMNQGQIAAHRRINKAERYQRPCSNLVRDVGSS